MSERLNTQDLIGLLINRQGLERKESENFIKEFFSLIEEGLERDKSVKINGLGTFKLVDVKSRGSVNVNTGERIEIQGHTKISFTPDTTLRNVINKPFAHFETVILNDDVDFNDLVQDISEEIEPVEAKITKDVENIAKDKEATETASNEGASDSQKNKIPEEETNDIHQKEIKEKVTETGKEAQTIIKKNKVDEEITLSALKAKNEKVNSNNNKTLMIVVVLSILLCGTLLFFTYYSDIFPEKKKQAPVAIAPSVKTEVVTDSIPADSIKKPVTITEDPVVKPSTANQINKEKTMPFSKIPVNPDSTSYEIVGTKIQHTIKEDETLIRISYRYYGTKDLFPYLIMYNRSIIKNPNSVPLGTTINIPELKKK